VLKTERHGCMVNVDEPVGAGMHYVETYLELPEERELLIAVQGALAVWIDDVPVLDRDPRRWAVWPKFGVAVRLGAGRHRVLARLSDPYTSIRVMLPDGRPANAASSTDAAPGYSIAPPHRLAEPNVLELFKTRRDAARDDLASYVAAYLAHVEGQNDLANWLLEPLVKKPERATGIALTTAASFTENDPIFAPSQARDLVRVLHERAAERDPGLWQARLALALWEEERSGATEAVRAVAKLVDEFPQVPTVLGAKARLYSQLGWSAEYNAAIRRIVERFPDDVDALQAAVDVYDAEGATKQADTLVARLQKLDRDSEIVLTRALARRDYDSALAELRRLSVRRPERKDFIERIHDVMVRAGNAGETWKKLEAAIENEPRDQSARLALADARYATGDNAAVRRAIVDAVENGAPTDEIEGALDLIEGMTALEPYRVDGREVIAAYEKSGKHMPGTAARVLDYAAVWVRSDGASRMLEHEIIRVQSAEAIGKLAEHPRLEGLALAMRVIKRDGRVLEPEYVPGKPTVTLPHLEVGDFIETERIVSRGGDGEHGMQYAGPNWFFREENIAYARSELVVVSPKHKPLDIETRGDVPKPRVEDRGAVVVRRWRVDFSPAAPVEPHSAPVTEFLPSVRVGWGITLDQRLQALADSVSDETPVDPRIARIARRIVHPLPGKAVTQRARRLYRWVLANVEEGEESDGRRVVVGKHGNRWRGFMTLCRALGIPVAYAVGKNRLASPPLGPISEALLFDEPLLRVGGERESIWLTLASKYAPFGYVPAEVRGAPAYVLDGDKPKRVQTPADGSDDSLVYEAGGELLPDGAAKLQLTQGFHGKFAVALRGAIAQLPEQQLRDVIESRLLGRALRGARLVSHTLRHRDDLDSPLLIETRVEVSAFAQPSGGVLVFSPPFAPRISQLATLPARHTPLLIGEATHQEVRLRITLPKGAEVVSGVVPAEHTDGDRRVTIADRVETAKDGKKVLILDRTIDVPAGRIQPAEYPKFLAFARRADDALAASVRIRLAGAR
jgi:tetratricopeptide (TPR) repeat protein